MQDDTPLLSAVLDSSATVVAANPALVELLGPDSQDVLGSYLGSFLAPEHKGAASWEGADSQPVTWCGRRADGLPWCGKFAFFQPAPLPGQTLMTGIRRFGPVQWLDSRVHARLPRPAPGVDSVVSHDIRGALRGGSGFVSVVKRALDDPSISTLHDRLPKAAEHLAIAGRSVATADEIAEKVVNYMRWSTCLLTMQDVSLDELVLQANALSNETFAGPPADLRFGHLGRVVADPAHLRWALAEIITNARKFSDHPVTVQLGTHAAGSFCVLSVRDDGFGLDPELADDAVLPGRKLQARGDYPGVGMGLALCVMIFERHAGWCRIAPTGRDLASAAPPGATGTTVEVRLPSSSTT